QPSSVTLPQAVVFRLPRHYGADLASFPARVRPIELGEELNFPRDGSAHSKHDRIERLEPDLRAGKFLLPAVVHHPEFGARDGKGPWGGVSQGGAGEGAHGLRQKNTRFPGSSVHGRASCSTPPPSHPRHADT